MLVLERVGEPLFTFWRSASKPFQLEVALSLLPGGGAALGPACARLLFTDIDGTIVHYPDAQARWGAPKSGAAWGADSNDGGDGDRVEWVDKVGQRRGRGRRDAARGVRELLCVWERQWPLLPSLDPQV